MGVNIQKFSLRVVKETGGRYDLNKTMDTPVDAVRILNEIVELDKRAEEIFVIITMDVRNSITGLFEVSVGSINSSIVTPREVFKKAILQNAVFIILAHNHPSGFVEPSSNDIEITKRLIEIGELIGIKVVDHLILGRNDIFLSMKREGII